MTAAPAISRPVVLMDEAGKEEDQHLVERTQSGDTRAFDALIRKYTSRLYALVYNMTSNHDDTNDLLQDIFAKAYRSINGFRGHSSFYTWLHTIAVNMAINFLKKRARRQTLSIDNEDLNIEASRDFMDAASVRSPAREADLGELQERLRFAMGKLSLDHRTVVTLFDVQGLPHAEIAKILGISEGTVRSRLFYAHRQLQNYLSEFLKNAPQ